KPTETYEYTYEPPTSYTEDPKKPLLKAKKLPNGRFQEVEYYHKGTNLLDLSKDKTQDIRKFEIEEDDFRYHRVKLIKAPVGHDKTPIITHRFIYEVNRDEPVKKTDREYSGRTKVFDAYLRKTIYEYNKQHRPTSIKRFDGNKNLYSEE